MEHKGFVIAGTHSGCGKTTLTAGILSALTQKGRRVQPFKSGPDYIDPGFHSIAAGRSCRNLDTRMLDEAVVRELYSRRMKDADIGVVEGVMGLFDGSGARDERGSAAHLSKVLGLPVVLVIDAGAMARSAGAMAAGFAAYDPGIDVAGFIMNRVGSDRHAAIITRAVEDATGKPVIGCLRRNADFGLPERHLGLVPAWENAGVGEAIAGVGETVGASLDLEALEHLAAGARPLPDEEPRVFVGPSVKTDTVIAVARDAAFCFYYEDNLDLLRRAGAETVFFSPITDDDLPSGSAGVWFGGGYPELHCERLSRNAALFRKLRTAADAGMPIFGECGGYMYLSKAIVDKEGRCHSMANLLPGVAVMGHRLASLGYCDARLARDTIFGPSGTALRGHLFHWSEMTERPDAPALFRVAGNDGNIAAGDGRNGVVGSWMHVHFASNPDAARNFVESARRWKENRQ